MGVPYDADMVNAWRSKRLIYRAMEENEADKKFMTALGNDPVVLGLSSPQLLKPQGEGDTKKFMEFLSKSCLVVLACIPPEALAENESAVDGTEGSAKTASPPSSDAKHTTPKEAAPTPIGFVAIGESKFSHHRNGQIGISMLEKYRGKGYGGEMINWILDWGFRRAGLHRIEIGGFSYNPNALKLYRSLGFVDEGREREAAYYDRKWYDIVKLSMLEHEWEKLRGVGT